MAFYKIRPKSGTADQWTTANPVLGEREIGYEYPTGGLGKGIVQMKMGDGKTAWNDLPYAQVIPMTKNDIVTVESTANDKVPSAGYVKKKFDSLNSTLTNGKIYNAGDYDANILTYAETLRDNSFTIIRYRGYSSTGESINAAPTNASGAAIIIRTSINYMAIIAIPFDNTGVYSRVKDNGTWKAWTH